MKQAKATVAEAEKLLRWLQQHDDAPPYNRTIHGYLLMLEHCADPAKDYIDWKPGTSPQEIDALKQRAEAAEARLADWFEVVDSDGVRLAAFPMYGLARDYADGTDWTIRAARHSR